MSSKENKKYWEECNADYSKVWVPPGRAEMSRRELNFISAQLAAFSPKKLLDVGVGNGRILEKLSECSSDDAEIYGIDISDQMVEICKNKFKKNNKIKSIIVCDLSEEDLPLGVRFNFVTMIRVLKYNNEWREMIRRVFNHMDTNSAYIFTMPNINSISRFSGDTFSDKNLRILHSSRKEIKELLLNIGFGRVEFVAFSKLPNFLYHICGNRLYVKCLLLTEKLLEGVLGKSFLGRELFVLAIK